MKHAEDCGCFSMPDVEPDRAVEGRLLLDEQVRQLVARRPAGPPASRSSPAPRPSRGSCRPRARSGRARCSRAPAMPSWPRKYFEATMLVAVWHQVVGTSMPCCSKTGWPALVVDDGRAQLPGHLVVGVASRLREVPPESQARAFVRVRRGAGVCSRVLHGMSRHRRYLSSGGAISVLLATTLRATSGCSRQPNRRGGLFCRSGDGDYREKHPGGVKEKTQPVVARALSNTIIWQISELQPITSCGSARTDD